MPGFPNLDVVERYIHGGTIYEPPISNIPAPPQAGALPPETPINKDTATIMLSDTQFERLLSATVNQQPAAPPKMAALPITQAVNTELGAILAPNGAGKGIAEFGSNAVDLIGNITFGTVNRAGKTVTTLIDNMIDIITFGYGMRK